MAASTIDHVEYALDRRQKLRAESSSCSLTLCLVQVVHHRQWRIGKAHGIADCAREGKVLPMLFAADMSPQMDVDFISVTGNYCQCPRWARYGCKMVCPQPLGNSGRRSQSFASICGDLGAKRSSSPVSASPTLLVITPTRQLANLTGDSRKIRQPRCVLRKRLRFARPPQKLSSTHEVLPSDPCQERKHSVYRCGAAGHTRIGVLRDEVWEDSGGVRKAARGRAGARQLSCDAR